MSTLSPTADVTPVTQNILRRYPLLSYFVIAYAFTWTWILVFLLGLGIPLNAYTNILVILGPTVAGFSMTYVMEGRPGLIHFLQRFILWRVNVIWYILILLGPPLLFNAGVAVLPGTLATFQLPAAGAVKGFPIFALLVLLIGGPLLEEPGWRGFALPRMQVRFGPFRATLLLGILWGCWHLPLFLIPVWAGQNGGFTPTTVAIFLTTVIAFTFIFTWVFNHTKGSLLIVILLHTVINSMGVFLLFQTDPTIGGLIGFGAFALAVTIVTRGRLGYDRYLEAQARGET